MHDAWDSVAVASFHRERIGLHVAGSRTKSTVSQRLGRVDEACAAADALVAALLRNGRCTGPSREPRMHWWRYSSYAWGMWSMMVWPAALLLVLLWALLWRPSGPVALACRRFSAARISECFHGELLMSLP